MLSVPLSPKVTDAQTKVKLKIPQLTLGDLAQMDRHWDENTKVLVYLVQIPLEENILLKLNYPSLRNNTKMTTLSALCNYGKTRIHRNSPSTKVFSYYAHLSNAIKAMNCTQFDESFP